jgi:hypothetical protein
MSKTHYVNIIDGKKEYAILDVKTLDSNTFNSVLKTPKLQEKLYVVIVSQEQREAMKNGKTISAAELGAINGSEVKQLAEKNNLLETGRKEDKNEIAALQKQLADMRKQEPASEPAEVNEVAEPKTAKKGK